MKQLFSEIPFLQSERIVLRKLSLSDAESLQKLINSPAVYRYLPTFLFEQQYKNAKEVISHLYNECLQESLIWGVFANDEFCGLAELYGYRAPIHKISVGYRFLEEFWGKGIATETLGLIVSYLYTQTNIEIITASTMVENQESAGVLKINDFTLVVQNALEDWGYETLTVADKWIR